MPNSVEDIESKALKFVTEAYKTYKDRSGLEDKWQEADKIYNCIPTEKFYQGTSNQYPPETRRACKTLINFIDETIGDMPFRIIGHGGNNDNKKAELETKMLIRDLAHAKVRMKMRQKGYENLVKYGTLIVKAPYLLNERKIIADASERRKIRAGFFEKVMSKFRDVKKTTETLFDGTGFEVMDIHAMYWNYYRKWEEQDCIIERRVVTWNHLKANEMRMIDGKMIGVYRNLDKVQKEEDYSDKKTEETIQENFDHIADLTGLTGSFSTGGKKYELLEAWCNFDLDGDGIDEECVIAIINGKHIVRLDPNPHDIQRKPYFNAVWESIEGASVGMGVPQICRRDQIALNDYMNQVMDNITQILNNMWIVDALANIPDAQLKSRPNGIIKSQTGVNGVAPIVKQLTANEGLKAVSVVRESIRSNSGATGALQGIPAKYDTTATEIESQSNAGARDVFTKIRMIEDCIIKPYLEQARSNNWQFRSQEEMVRIFGKDATHIYVAQQQQDIRDMLIRDEDITILSATQIENKVVKVQQLLNFLNIASKTGQGIVNFPLLHEKIWDLLGDGDESMILPQPDDFMIKPSDENILMSQGEECIAKPNEKHRDHIVAHSSYPFPAEMQPLVDAHIQQHISIEQAMIQQQQMAMQAQMQDNAMGGGFAVRPQMQPRLAPDQMTEGNAGKMSGMPVPPTGV